MNQKKNKNVFICTSEFHLLSTIRLCSSILKEEDNHVIVAYGRRMVDYLKYNLNSPFMKFYPIYYRELEKARFANCDVFISVNKLFVFNENISTDYLFSQLKNKKVIGVLMPDGNKAYALETNRSFLSLLNHNKKRLFFNLKNGILESGFISNKHLKYGASKYTNEIWLEESIENPHKFRKGVKIKFLPEWKNNMIEALYSIFQCDKIDILPENDILYVTGKFKTKNGTNEEFEAVKLLATKYKNNTIHIALHPRVQEKEANGFKELSNNVKLLDRPHYPLELFILKQKHIKIVSIGSTALLVENKDCKYFYLQNLGNFKLDRRISVLNVPSHIHLVKNINEI